MKHPSPSPINRELSQLAFNRRVLALAQDPATPLLEQLRFLCIVSNNLDEFFEIRVAGLKEQLRARLPPPGMTLPGLRALLGVIGDETRLLVAEQYRLLNEAILPALAAEGIRLLRRDALDARQRAWVADYFRREVRPLLTPIGLDPAHPFPQVANKSLNFVVELTGHDAFGRDTTIATVKAPRLLPRVIALPRAIAGSDNAFVLLSSVIHAHMHELFGGREIVGYSQFRVTRDADLWFDEEEVKNLRQALEGELPQRHFGQAVRLEVAEGCPEKLAQFLLRQFDLSDGDLYRVGGPVNLARMAALIDSVAVTGLEYRPFVPGLPDRLRDSADLLTTIRQQDVLLHHPFQSFDPVVEFIRKAADDPDVVAIKQTVYRTGVNSVLMEALIEAARRGKEVTVVVELLARFDEEANINWAERLEEVGAQVVYGVFGLKTHAKLALLLRRERDAKGRTRLQAYAHLGTGNYHPRTARQYTDFGLLTANRDICADVNEVFLHITSLAKAKRLKHLLLAPFTMHDRVLFAIRREARHAREGRPARIVAKMNALLEEAVIRALYAASQAGVEIDLIVRGACALRPGVEGFSENIRVRSIVGRFLEHTRIWHFANDGGDEVWLSSADWMGRNLFRRIEVAFPVLDPELKARVIAEGLKPYLADNCDAWVLAGDGTYARARGTRRARPRAAQQELVDRLAEQPGADSR
jgi:polyphosphate kinase